MPALPKSTARPTLTESITVPVGYLILLVLTINALWIYAITSNPYQLSWNSLLGLFLLLASVVHLPMTILSFWVLPWLEDHTWHRPRLHQCLNITLWYGCTTISALYIIGTVLTIMY